MRTADHLYTLPTFKMIDLKYMIKGLLTAYVKINLTMFPSSILIFITESDLFTTITFVFLLFALRMISLLNLLPREEGLKI